MSDISVVGAGAFGTALAISLANDGRNVALYARDARQVAAMNQHRENSKYLAGHKFPQTLRAVDSVGVADVTLLTVPTQKLRSLLRESKHFLDRQMLAVCCKGIEKETGLLPSQIVAEVLGEPSVAVLTGPGFAGEIAAGKPTALCIAAHGSTTVDLQRVLSTSNIRLYLSRDPIGAQLGGALKNVVAIACGIAMGAGLGESARAALMTRGYNEMTRLAVALGAEKETLSGLSGLGDLALTCTSVQSRNFSFGLDLGAQRAATRTATIEGAATARATADLARRHGIEMPIARAVADVLENTVTVKEAMQALLARPLRSEI